MLRLYDGRTLWRLDECLPPYANRTPSHGKNAFGLTRTRRPGRFTSAFEDRRPDGLAMNERIELLLRILCDVLPARADAAYLFAETEPNQESVFVAGRRLLDEGRVGRLLISDCGPKSGYIGAPAYRQAMSRHGIAREAIEEIPMEPTEILHTLIEAQAVVRHAQAKDYEKLIVVSIPLHQERAFITVVSVALREYPSLRLYSLPGRAQPWDKVVTHSQGVQKATRAEWITAEQQRIEKYTATDDLAPGDRILGYLRTRR